MDLNKPLFQATLGDFKEILEELFQTELINVPKTAPKKYVYGIAGIAKLFNCSESAAQRIKRDGEIDDAISQTGDIIVVDAEYALDLLRLSKKHKPISLKSRKK